ncbi:MAG: HAD family hydrolase [Endomicrobiia bacterium]
MEKHNKYPIVFLDRDGTLIVDKVYLNNPDEVEFLEGVKEGLKKLVLAGFRLVIITNQSGIGRGLVEIKNLELIHTKIKNELSLEGIEIFKIYYCPHLPEENCECRKPKIGMIKEILNSIDKQKSFIVGDKETDAEFGKNLGIRSILINKNLIYNTTADYVVKDFKSAVEVILRCLRNS